MKVLILAAGYATRLYPRTIHFPKPLLEVNKKPIIEYLIEKVRQLQDVSKVIVVTNARFADTFKKWAKGLKIPLKIEIVNDLTRSPEDRLGAVGDMHLVFKRESFRGDFLVMGGDNF
ncbi:MAG: sugar phosphate nucleotidyltransferase, partial [Candidatus Omnitrophica bacterium]|nr:sugar phosphate nucleotidyltransferase [Candidatus Omnitrophota bacterium]